MSEDGTKKNIFFNATKKETHHINNGFKKMFRKLRTFANAQLNSDEITLDSMSEADLLVFGNPREPFTVDEIKSLKAWVSGGGRLLFLTGEGTSTHINSFLEEYGMQTNSDSVIRSAFYKYMHPKEVFIGESVIIPDMIHKKNSIQVSQSKKTTTSQKDSKSKNEDNFGIVYPYGVTLKSNRPSIPFLISGNTSYPLNRPLGCMWESETISNTKNKRGRIVTIGSIEMFSDDWIDKEENSKLFDMVLLWLLDLADIDITSNRRESEIKEFTTIPSIEALSQVLKPCLQSNDELPRDFTKLFNISMNVDTEIVNHQATRLGTNNLFEFNFNKLPQVLKLYKTLNLPQEPLTLITPQFECPHPKLHCATFPPILREFEPPSLEQFDLDEHFAKENVKLFKLAKKCGLENISSSISSGPGSQHGQSLISDDDLEYFIMEAGDITGISHSMQFEEKNAKQILYLLFKQIIEFKKQDFGKQQTESIDYQGFDYSGIAADHEVSYNAGSAPRPTHVDLAPMNLNRNNLIDLDPNLHIGGSRALPSLHK